MTETWAAMEFHTLDLGDSRLNKRAVKLIETFKHSSGLPRLD